MISASGSDKFDVIVIGAGPGGVSAAIWCADLGLKTLILEEKDEVGGQLLWTFNLITNYPGILSATALELRDSFLKHIEKTDVTISTSARIANIDLTAKTVELEDGRRYLSRAVIIATGVRRRDLGVPGETKFAGRGVLSSGVRDRGEVIGKRVIIGGGGDAALENAIMLSRGAAEVLLVHRGERFSARAEFVNTIKEIPNVSVRFHSRIKTISGVDQVSEVEILNSGSGKASTHPTDKVLIRIGVAPNTRLFYGVIDLDKDGYIKVGADCSTNVADIFAVGDVANPLSPTIATAVGMGATAAKSIVR